MSLEQLESMHTWDVSNIENMQTWINFLEKYNVFFSAPLDLDFLMLEKFGNKYKLSLENTEGPRIEKIGKIIDIEKIEPHSDEYKERIAKDVSNSLKDCGGDGSTYTFQQQQLMVWYNYFFLNRGKPSTHLLALSKTEDAELAANIPDIIGKIIDVAKDILG